MSDSLKNQDRDHPDQPDRHDPAVETWQPLNLLMREWLNDFAFGNTVSEVIESFCASFENGLRRFAKILLDQLTPTLSGPLAYFDFSKIRLIFRIRQPRPGEELLPSDDTVSLDDGLPFRM